MSSGDPHLDCAESVDAAPYVLGALEDAGPYRKHLATCVTCQTEVAELQGVADVLSTAVEPVVAPEALRERVLAEVRSEAKLLRAAGGDADQPSRTAGRFTSRRFSLLTAGAAITASAAAAAAIALTVGSSPRERVTSASSAPLGAHVALRQVGARADLVVSGMPAPPIGRIYEVWLSRGAGPPQPTDALFSVTSRGLGSVNVPDSLHGVKEVLVTSEPLGGSSHPTSPPLIRVAVAA